MKEVLDINRIKVNVQADSKEVVLRKVAKLAFDSDIIESEEEYLKGLFEREEECTTGFGKGFAIPHCKSTTVKKASVIVMKLAKKIDWESMDDKPVNFILALAVPEGEAGTTHIKILSKIARCLMDEEFTTKLNQSINEDEIYNYLIERLGGI